MQVHQIWLDDIIPDKIQTMMATWRSSGYPYRLWRREDLAKYDEEFNKSGMKIYHPALQSDLYKLLIIRDFGGLYVDCDSTLRATLPQLPDDFCGIYGNDALMPDPWIIYSSYTNNDLISKIITEGMNMPNDADPLHRFGYKAFIRKWTSNILDTRAWITHANNYSWRPMQGTANSRRK